MLFNSIEFAVFLPLVFVLYWFAAARKTGLQNLLLLAASYLFYGWWDWRFLSLILLSSMVDFLVGLGLAEVRARSMRRLLLGLSLGVNLGLLGFFKYFNFFAQSFSDAFTLFGHHIDPARLYIILPVGISFYTFQTLSYSIDVYRGNMEASKDIISFFAFVAFFPQLVAGPIERASNLLPQFQRPRVFSYDSALDGSRQILWGLFKKIVIADNAAVFADHIFNHSAELPGSTLVLGAVFFALQIYGDFSGYSDIAIGTARLFGFDLMRNFAFPYFSRDIAEFWRRWHISLSTWFRDYVYIPLGGSRGNRWKQIRNVLIIFVVSGFWHGANWTFIVWGALNALYFLPLLLRDRNRSHTNTVAEGRILPGIRETFQMAVTFALTCLAWVFFRAATVGDALTYIGNIFSATLFTPPTLAFGYFPLVALLFLAAEWLQRDREHVLQLSGKRMPAPLRWTLYYGIAALIFYYGGEPQTFIYFQF
ncbi:MBOAT family protein [bacterium]|nr:MBOAT family protein [bacterium]